MEWERKFNHLYSQNLKTIKNLQLKRKNQMNGLVCSI